MSVKARYVCSACGRQLKEGEFVAVVGTTPPTGFSAPQGRADAILRNVGKLYCDACFRERYERRDRNSGSEAPGSQPR